jgi:membrane-bound lytic murein transglycosylase B
VTSRLIALILSAALLTACQSTGGMTGSPQAEAKSGGAEGAVPSAGQPAGPSFEEWREAFKVEAMAAGVSAATFDQAFLGVSPDAEILAKESDQPEYVRPIWAYLDTAVSPERIATGQALLTANQAALERETRPYGVEPRFVVAIWGLESAYGANTGGYNVIEALATLAYGSRRGDVFRRNLLDALLILENGDISAPAMQGSWAGAMGQTQFMPAAFRTYAVDGDGDGRRDIWGSLPDVFASTANYLAAHDWQPGESWGTEVRLPQNFAWELAEIDVRKPVSEWQQMGIRRADGAALPRFAAPTSVIAPAGHRGPAFLVAGNFRTLLQYNYSISYALAVGHLADRITGGGEFVAQWPREEPVLSRTDKLDLQGLLAQRGYDPGEIDGVIGPKTRSAIRSFQREISEVPDGYPTMDLLQRLRAVVAS